LPSFSAVASPSPSSSPASPSHGEQYPLLNFPSSSALWRAHKLAGAATPPPSGVGRRRGTIDSLDPLSHALVASLRFASTHASFGAPQRVVEPRRRAIRRAPPHPDEPRCHSRLHVFWVVGSLIHGADQIQGIPLRCGPPWTHAPGARRGPPHTSASAAVGSEIHGAATTFSLKSP
jgi:hypothetical protein